MSGRYYPHTLKFNLVSGEEPMQDDKGDYVQNGTTSEVRLACRVEINSEGKQVGNEDGEQVNYSFSVFLPKQADVIPYGTEVTLSEGQRLIGQGTVKNMVLNRFNARLWV